MSTLFASAGLVAHQQRLGAATADAGETTRDAPNDLPSVRDIDALPSDNFVDA